MPVSLCCAVKLYTEYASPRFSRTSWNSREDMPPPSAAFSTPSANLRSSVRRSPVQPRTRLACSMPRGTSRTPVPAGLGRTDERRFALGVLNAALGGGMSSRLFQEVREKRGLAYSVYSFTGQHAETGLWGIYAGCAPAKADDVLAI